MDSLVAENVRHRPLRTAISVAGVALGVVLIVLTVGLARGMMRDSATRQANVNAEIMFYPAGDFSPATGQVLSLDTIYATAIQSGSPRIPAVAGVAAVSPVAQYLQTSQTGIGFEIIEGIDVASYGAVTDWRVVDGRAPAGKEAVVDRTYVRNKKDVNGQEVRIGSEIILFGTRVPVVAIYEPEVGARVKMPLDTLQRFVVGGADKCSFLLVKCENPAEQLLVADELREKYPANRVVLTSELPSLFAGSIGSLETFLNVVVGLAAVISTLVTLLGMYTTIIERTREIGVLKSLGASRLFIVSVIEKEALLISVIGIGLGAAISLAGRYGIEAVTSLHVDIDLKWLAIAAVIGLAGGAIGALYPALRAAALDPVQALSYE